jgi:UPF0716 protein FxsA
MRWIFLFFIAVPLIEMLLLFEVADYIGGLWTIFLVVLTAVIGVQILKRQGLSTLFRANQRLNSGQLPGQEVIEGFFLAFAGALLLTPGFITDTLGFLCLTSPLRRRIARKFIESGLLISTRAGSSRSFYWRSGGFGQARDDHTFEGEYFEESDFIASNEDDDLPGAR